MCAKILTHLAEPERDAAGGLGKLMHRRTLPPGVAGTGGTLRRDVSRRHRGVEVHDAVRGERLDLVVTVVPER